MYNEVGKKIKGIARAATILGIIAAVIGGIIYMIIAFEAADYEMPREMMSALGVIVTGLGIVVGGSFAAWAASLLLYGFGQLIDNSDRMVELMDEANDLLCDGGTENGNFDDDSDEERVRHALQQLYQLYQNGSITDEDYQQKRKRLLAQYNRNNR